MKFSSKLFLVEGILKILSGLSFLLLPNYYLIKALPVVPPLTDSSVALFRSIGSQTLAFSIPLLLASRETPTAMASRRIVYWTMFSRETFLFLTLLLHNTDQPGGFTQKAVQSWLMELAPFILGRLWVLLMKDNWLC
ncbi:hypothetical protein F5880DRAFT_1587945 [Lentinula raphanica]|nr:hypothetical protein F5880DRAFT_1587945 [Lentinula raphanica]